jgi:hypothetical protein
VGPSELPVEEDEADLRQQYTTTLPANWVVPGLEVELSVDPDSFYDEQNESNNKALLQPKIGKGTVLYLTSVPVVHQGKTATVLDVQEGMLRVWPLKEVSNKIRAPYTFTGTVGGIQGWGKLLDEIGRLRETDGSDRYYYGFVRVGGGSGVYGIGYVGDPAAIGRDDSLGTALHEIGHNMGREHAPCGVQDFDSQYPYPNAKLGSWGYDWKTKKLIDPEKHYDLMSYCQPEWISDYNYNKVQARLEMWPPKAAYVKPSAYVLVISGRIGAEGVALNPIHRLYGTARPLVEGPYSVELTTASGVTRLPFELKRVADLDGEYHFSMVVPDVGMLTAVRVLHASKELLVRKAAAMAPEPQLTARENAGWAQIDWDASAYPYATVAHLGGEGRTTLTLSAEGGSVKVSTQGLPPGGELELSLSDGVNSVRRTIRR